MYVPLGARLYYPRFGVGFDPRRLASAKRLRKRTQEARKRRARDVREEATQNKRRHENERAVGGSEPLAHTRKRTRRGTETQARRKKRTAQRPVVREEHRPPKSTRRSTARRTSHVQRPTCREPPRAQKLTNGVRAETNQNNKNIPEERTERRTAYVESLNEIDKYEID